MGLGPQGPRRATDIDGGDLGLLLLLLRQGCIVTVWYLRPPLTSSEAQLTILNTGVLP